MGYDIQNQAMTVAAASSLASLREAFSVLALTCNNDVTITIPGTRAAPVKTTFADASGLVFNQALAGGGKTLTLQADASAYSGVLDLTGGGAGFITVDKAALGWNAGDWAGASLLVLRIPSASWATFNTNAGEVRTVAPGGIYETAADGTAGVGYWRIDVTVNFTVSFGLAAVAGIKVCLHAAVLENTQAPVYPILSVSGDRGDFIFAINNIGFIGSIHVTNFANVRFTGCSVFNIPDIGHGYGCLSDYGGFAYFIGCNFVRLPYYALLAENRGYGRLSADSYVTYCCYRTCVLSTFVNSGGGNYDTMVLHTSCGDRTAQYPAGTQFHIVGQGPWDGLRTVSSSSWDGTNTKVILTDVINNNTAAGFAGANAAITNRDFEGACGILVVQNTWLTRCGVYWTAAITLLAYAIRLEGMTSFGYMTDNDLIYQNAAAQMACADNGTCYVNNFTINDGGGSITETIINSGVYI